MNKKDVLKILDIASLCSIVIATLLVLIFEFTGSSVLVKYAIVLYAASFLIAIIYYSVRLYFGTQKYSASSEHAMLEFQPGQKTSTIIKLVLVCLAFIFTSIVLILY